VCAYGRRRFMGAESAVVRVERLLASLGVRREEVGLVGLLLALYFVLISAVVLIQSMAFGLFIADFGPQRLPYAYLTIAVLASLVAFAYLRIGARVSFGRLLSVNLGFLALGSLALWLGLGTTGRATAVFLLPVWFQIFVTLANLAVWPLALRLFDVRQSKRLFGLIGAGNWIANVIGGLAVPSLVALVGPANLLLLAALVVVGAWFVLRVILAAHVHDAAPATRPGARAPASAPLGGYALRIFGYVALWWLAFYFVDAIFFAHVGARFADAAQLTAFMGRFLSVTGAIALVTTVALTGRILGRFGLAAGLLTMPVLVSTAIAAVATLGASGVSAMVLFWAASAGKLLNVAFGFSLSQTANTVMYQALAARQRERVQTIAEGIVQPLAIGAAGAALLVLTALLGLDGVGLAWVFLPIAAVWILLASGVARSYVGTLAGALVRRRWGREGPIVGDATSVELLRRHLHSPHPGAVIYALERLGERPGGLPVADIPALLAHPAPEVRAAVLQVLETTGAPEVAHLLPGRLATEAVPALRGAVLRVMAASGAPGAAAALAAALVDPDRVVRYAAMTALLRHGGREGAGTVGAAVGALAASPAPADRALAASVLALGAMAHLHDTLRALLADDHVEVRRAALAAAAVARLPLLWPSVVAVAGAVGTTPHVVRALAAGGEDALDAIEAALDVGDASDAQATVFVDACRRIGGAHAVRLLLRLYERPVGAIRRQVLEALAAAGRALEPALVRDEIRGCRERMHATVAIGAFVAAAGGAPLLAAALETAWRQERDHVLLLLAHVLLAQGRDPHAVLDARAPLLQGDPARSAQALEVVDALVAPDLRLMVMPWLESPSAAARRERGDHRGEAERLGGLVMGPAAVWHGPWLSACALHAIGSLGLADGAAAVRFAERSHDPLIADAARWARRRAEARPETEETSMLSVLERVVVLKTVGIFAATPDAVLADVADLLEEVDADAGTVVIRQGDVGDSLYVIVDGAVEVTDGARVVDRLGVREVFGEMALLDPAPRMASVTATEPTRLLRLDQAPFGALLLDRPEIAVAILRVLSQRLRARVEEATARQGATALPVPPASA
jgi:ATP/ADP translocase